MCFPQAKKKNKHQKANKSAKAQETAPSEPAPDTITPDGIYKISDDEDFELFDNMDTSGDGLHVIEDEEEEDKDDDQIVAIKGHKILKKNNQLKLKIKWKRENNPRMEDAKGVFEDAEELVLAYVGEHPEIAFHFLDWKNGDKLKEIADKHSKEAAEKEATVETSEDNPEVSACVSL